MRKIADHTPARRTLSVIGVAVGALAGFVDSYLGIDVTWSASLLGWLPGSLIVVVLLHESLHGAVAALLGHKPIFGVRLPLIYITFRDKIPRGHYMLVAIAPFIILNFILALLYARGVLRLFCDLGLIINSIGSLGDILAVLKLASGPKSALIQDTKSGFEVWVADEKTRENLAAPAEV